MADDVRMALEELLRQAEPALLQCRVGGDSGRAEGGGPDPDVSGELTCSHRPCRHGR
jgi:hypothetical protein